MSAMHSNCIIYFAVNKLYVLGYFSLVCLSLEPEIDCFYNDGVLSLQIFDTTRKLKTIDVLALDKHGKIIDNDGMYVVYL